MLKTIVKYILKWEARLVLRKHKPRIIAVTGSVGKTSTKDAIYEAVRGHFRTRKTPKSYNSEIGVPLTILGLESEWHSFWGWTKNIIKGLKPFFGREYPELLVLEMGVDRPGDIDYMLEIAPPFMSVVTAIGEVPVHVEFFSGPKALAEEKGKILEATPSDGFTILNSDDEVVYNMRHKARGTVVSYGFGASADIRISAYRFSTHRRGGDMVPAGITFKLDYRGSTVPVRLPYAYGKQQAYTIAAAVAASVSLGLHMVEIVEAFQGYVPPPGRLRLIEGVKDTWIFDDTYNASPMAMHAALDVLRQAPGKRKIAVLGDMLEIGKFTIEAHQGMGELVASFADALFAVGPRAKFIATEARARGMTHDQVFEFSNANDAGRALEDFIEPGDVIVIKGSQSMRMERVTEEIMTHPEEASRLLCRQEPYWKTKI